MVLSATAPSCFLFSIFCRTEKAGSINREMLVSFLSLGAQLTPVPNEPRVPKRHVEAKHLHFGPRLLGL